jgi:hypothetical protein
MNQSGKAWSGVSGSLSHTTTISLRVGVNNNNEAA